MNGLTKFFGRPLALCTLLLSCSAQHVLLEPKDLHRNQTVLFETTDGEKVSGVVVLANGEAVLVNDSYGEERGFLLKNIVTIKGPQPVLDENGVIVSEAEIDSFRTNANLTTYAIVGGIISGGVSFLAASLMTHEVFNIDSEAPVYIGTTAGLAAGTVLFAESGARRDRDKAIENVLASRTEPGYVISLPDQNDDIILRQKIKEIIEERMKLEAEIDQLLNEMDEIEEPKEEKK
ncbi:hypothetical protein JXA02_00635 [candidate division KSB1 bacterium]|nr:hypothetical protein [candidate division KSB1 bacterium]RQW11420.1 MAG: hypothetical protein EH222_00670 [candidate division KSB1 bacterium]